MESIKKLKSICQMDFERKKRQPWYARTITMKLSIYLTKVFLYTPVSANQVTLLMIVNGITAGVFLSFGNYWFSICGALILQIWYILDYVDGEVARYRKQSSLAGKYLDLMSHDLVHPIIFIGLSFGVYATNTNILGIFNAYHNPIVFIFGFLAAISIVVKNTVWLNRIFVFVTSRKMEKKGLEKVFGAQYEAERDMERGKMRKIYRRVNFSFGFPAIMNVILIGAIFNCLYTVLFIYGLVLPIIVCLRILSQFHYLYNLERR